MSERRAGAATEPRAWADQPEWVACIARTDAGNETKNWCGRDGGTRWRFVSIDHAAYNSGRLLPCGDCLDAVVKALREQ